MVAIVRSRGQGGRIRRQFDGWSEPHVFPQAVCAYNGLTQCLLSPNQGMIEFAQLLLGSLNNTVLLQLLQLRGGNRSDDIRMRGQISCKNNIRPALNQQVKLSTT